MYFSVAEPWTRAVLDNGSIVAPLATLTDEYGGVLHIIKDDNCYALIYNADVIAEPPNPKFSLIPYWCESAAIALASYLIEHDIMPSKIQEGEK
jgi:hypothetical protein